MKRYELKTLLTVQYSFQDSSSSSSSFSSSEESQEEDGLPRKPTVSSRFHPLTSILSRAELIKELEGRIREGKERDDKLIEEAMEALDNYRFVIDESRINNEENNKLSSENSVSYNKNILFLF
uniref:Uncharacterized protein n=1 Tax=Strongyloides papillosus TaxID=174720 RepID=A0A0N5BMI3_STREA